MRRSLPVATAGLLAVLFASAPARAGIIFFSNDPAGFAAAMAGATSLGTETFEQSTLAPGSVVILNDPLTQGVPNGPFPAGLIAPLTVQSNLDPGAAATSPNPRGLNGLAAISAGFAGAVSDVVVSNTFVDSHDLIFNPADQVTGVGFNTINFFGTATIEVRVFSTANVLLGTTSIAGDEAGTNFLGVQATGGDLIGRINLFSTAPGNDGAEGADNIQIFAGVAQAPVPEPTSLALALLGAGSFCGAALRARRRRAAA